jgi:hypothetical protein
MKTLIVLVLLVGCAEEKKEFMYQSGPYICEEFSGSALYKCINMSDMSEVNKIYNAANVIEIEVGK